MTTRDETRTVHDPFLNRDVQVSNKLTDRLRGRYACGPIMPNGEPEFGWREFEVPPIQHEAATALEAKDAEIAEWRQAASVEANLRREFLARAEAAESRISDLERQLAEETERCAKWHEDQAATLDVEISAIIDGGGWVDGWRKARAKWHRTSAAAIRGGAK